MKPTFRLPRIGVLLTFVSLPWLQNLNAAETSWTTWRGPSGAGVAAGARPPTTWSDQQNIKWKVKLPGSGFSTPIIWKDRIFLLSAIETTEEQPAAAAVAAPAPAPKEEGDTRRRRGGFGGVPKPTRYHDFIVMAVDRKTGGMLWQKTARREVPHEARHETNTYASASPVTDGKRLFVSFGSRGLYCYDLDGALLWEKDLGNMQTRGSFGEGSSPALAGDRLIVPWDHEGQSFIVALDTKTGAEVWRQTRDERSSWSTPLIVEVNGRWQAVVAATKRTRSYDVATGEVVWEAGGLTPNVIPTPVTGHGLVYVMSGFQGNSIQAIKLTSRGDITDTDNIVWSARKSAPYVPSPVLSGDRLYASKSRDAFLSCMNALTGEVHYQDQALGGLGGLYASPVAANGYLYVAGRDGTVLVLKDQTTYEVVATNKLSDRIDASPVMVDRELFLRGHQFLYCIAEG